MTRDESRRPMEQILALLHFLQENQIDLEQFLAGGGGLSALPEVASMEAACGLIRFMDEMPGGFLIYRAGGGEEVLYANRALLRILRCESMGEFRALTGNSFRGMVHPEDLEAVERSIWEQIAQSRYDLDYVEYRVLCRDGAIRWIEDYGHFIHSQSVGDIFYVFLGDATEKRSRYLLETEHLLSERERQVQALIAAYDRERSLINQEHLRRLEVIEGLSVNYESILYADLAGDTIVPYRLSVRTQLQFGEKFQARSLDWYVRDYVRVWVHPADRELVAAATSPAYIREKLAGSVTYYINYRVVVAGEVQYLQLRIVNVSRGEDISQVVLGYRRMDKELLEEQEQKQLLAEALNNANLAIVAKNTFLSNMSHDMRTPLNAIFGFTALARKHAREPGVVEDYLDKVDVSSHQLLDLIDKVLEISWSESRESWMEEDACDLSGVVEEVHRLLSSRAAAKNIDLSLDCGGLRHREVFSDRGKLRQMLLYLASNAVTYTKPGGRVALRAEEGELLGSDYAIYRLSVEDTGIGISKGFLKHIFEPFKREKNTTFSGVHGTGLGLTIAKSIVDMLGGAIEVSSVPDQGSTFTVTLHLRMQCQTDTAPSAGLAGLLTGRRLLLVEDNEINLEIETEILRDLGFTVDTAADGQIAVEKVSASAPGAYDFVLMDIQMPTMDGWQAARAIRALPDPALAGPPIIALSANVFEGDVRTSIESGMDAHLTKPMDVPLLLKTVEEVLQKHGTYS